MSEGFNYSDTPIEVPDADVFGINGFVKSLARSVVTMKRPEGVVVALNGEWGSGKSSAINLLKHHLKASVEEGSIDIIAFNPWWYRGQDALTVGFFNELYLATKPSLSEAGKKALSKIGSGFLRLVNTIAPAADAVGAGGFGTVVGASAGWMSSLIENDESIERLHKQLAEALRDQKKRFVVIVDDIDRLSPDEAMMIFRLIKSVGRLPNITYVLAFDRHLSERMVSQQFPSEGAHYLEKIIQVSFDLPLPAGDSLNRFLLSNIGPIIGDVDEEKIVHIQNMYHDVVSPEIRTPRDASRYLNALSLTWPAVTGEVDVGDFLALEAYRLFQPGIYKAIRDNESLLCGETSSGLYGQKEDGNKIEVLLLNSVDSKVDYRRRLMRLFPRLEGIWSNVHYSGSDWRKQRRACVHEFFPIYFQLSLPDNVVPLSELREIISKADNQNFIAGYLRMASRTPVTSGGTRAALLLDALKTHASEVELSKVAALLAGLFSIADDIHVAADERKAFSVGDNPLRIHWLIRALLWNRTTLDERSRIILSAAKSASLYWFVDLALSAWQDYHPRDGGEQPSEEKRLCNEADSVVLYSGALTAIVAASSDGALIQNRELCWLLFRWRDLADDDGAQVKKWTKDKIASENSLCKIAESMISSSWTHSAGDVVSTRHDRVPVDSVGKILDSAMLLERLTTLRAAYPPDSRYHQVAERFLSAWQNSLSSRSE